MKSLRKTAAENPKKSWLTVITALIGVATLFVDQAEILGIDTDIVKWVGFGIAAVTAIITAINANTEIDNNH